MVIQNPAGISAPIGCSGWPHNLERVPIGDEYLRAYQLVATGVLKET